MTLSRLINFFTPNFEEKVIYKVRDNKLFRNVELIDTKTLERYRNESMLSIARKSCLIFFFNPIVLFLKVSFNVVQMGFDFVKVTVESTIEMTRDIRDRRIIKIFETYVLSRVNLFRYLAEDVVYIVRAPFYALALQFSSILGMLPPTMGIAKKMISKVEKHWNFDKGLKFDYRYNKDVQGKPFYESLLDIFLSRKQDIAFYLAPCFQPRGTITDTHIVACLDLDP